MSASAAPGYDGHPWPALFGIARALTRSASCLAIVRGTLARAAVVRS
jgi:hypothetical protein